MTRRENAIRVLICFLVALGLAATLGLGSHRYLGFSEPVSWVLFAAALSISYELAKLLAFRNR
jgi:hypothetical protein